MTRPLVIGLTGGVGCGKSSAADVLLADGVPVFDADHAAHQAVAPGSEGLRAIVEAFGPAYVREGELDRRAMAATVFGDAVARETLNAIVHPRVFAAMQDWLVANQQTRPAVVVMIPLLFEKGAEQWCDATLVVAADEARVMNRLAARGWSESDSRARMQAQWPLSRKIQRADRVIWNNGTKEELAAAVRDAYRSLILERKNRHE